MAPTGPRRSTTQVPRTQHEDDLGGHRGGPERADLGLADAEVAPVDRTERIEHGVARLGEGVDPHEDGEGRVHHQPADLAEARRRAG